MHRFISMHGASEGPTHVIAPRKDMHNDTVFRTSKMRASKARYYVPRRGFGEKVSAQNSNTISRNMLPIPCFGL